jgi:DNA-binding CsgD family transcriptional regulator
MPPAWSTASACCAATAAAVTPSTSTAAASAAPFAEGEAARLHGQASLLAALCVKHDRLCLERGDDAAAQGIDGHAARLAHLQRGLSRRELAVAARVLAGMTSEGIALDLGIGLQSVLTYRKRAYAKLGVSGQRQLFALALRPYRG